MEAQKPDDPLTDARVHLAKRSIAPVQELEGLGISFRDSLAWAVRDPKITSQFCRDILVHPDAREGEISRFEIYRERRHPEHCLCVIYREFFRGELGRVVENQFFTNDPGLLARNARYRPVTLDELRHVVRP